MVVYYCGSFIRYADIPQALWEDVDACIAAGDEILVGNDGFGHRVYGRCKSRQYENASVCKTTKPYPKLSCDEEMLKKCDRMIAVWDGESQEVVVNILLLLALQKKCNTNFKTFVKAAEAIKAGDYDAVREAVMDVFVRMDDSLYDAFNECTMVEMGLRHYTYYLFDEWYDPDVLIKKSHPCGMFGTFKQGEGWKKSE